jgi:hypothetical protein
VGNVNRFDAQNREIKVISSRKNTAEWELCEHSPNLCISLIHMSESDGSHDEARRLATDMIEKRVRKGTTTDYTNRLRKFAKWLATHDAAAVGADGFPTLPLDKGLTITFFGAVMKPRTDASVVHPIFGKPRLKTIENGGHVHSSTLGGYKSAIVWLYENRQMTIDHGLNLQLDELITGFL